MSTASTHAVTERRQPVIAIVGSPNVGKSVLFNKLTGRYVTVSNYPGTTVEVSRGTTKIHGRTVTVVDTPGMYGLSPLTEEERVARRMLVEDKPDVVVHVVDAKNLPRMLPLTAQLLEAGFDVIFALNLMDELDKAGMTASTQRLQDALGVPVIPASFLRGHGLPELLEEVHERLSR